MYRIASKTYSPDDAGFESALAAVYGTPNRPVCLCQHSGIEMYIAKIEDQYIIKRMPNSGWKHSPSCESYEPPAELSGRGEVMDGAISTDLAEGITTLKFDFALTKSGTRAAPEKTGVEHDSVRTDGKKLTLRGTLHYLYEEAGLTKWFPSMAGKRNWWVVRKYLLAAASDKIAKGNSLADMLYIPETFSVEKKEEISQRRMNTFRSLNTNTTGPRKLMLLIGEIKELGDARFGMKMVIKHLSDAHFMLNEDVYKRFLKRFNLELTLWAGIENSHLLAIATFGVGPSGVASIEEVSVMLVNDNWIPFENIDEKMLIETLVSKGRKFVKGLRYNLASKKVLASAVLADTEEPIALYIRPFGSDDNYVKELTEIKEESAIASWEWNTADKMPDLPSSI